MSSIATFYILPESRRTEFNEAHRNQKKVTYKRTLFGTKEIVTGERFLWEYLDSSTPNKTNFPHSGFVFIDYFFNFVTGSLPKNLVSQLASAALDENYYAFSADLAAGLSDFLQANPPESVALAAFATEQHPTGGDSYIQSLREAHALVLRWSGQVAPNSFGVLHITF